MQHQHRIHSIAPSFWPQCSKVEIRQDTIYCEWGLIRGYDLVEAYSKNPHIEFLNCESARDFQTFVRHWGPLLLFEEDWKRFKTAVELDHYRAYRSFLRSIKHMIDACKGHEDQRGSLVEYFTAEANMVSKGPFREDIKALSYLDKISPLSNELKGDPVEWTKSANIDAVRHVLASCVEDWVRSPHGWGLRVEERGKRFEIKPSFELYSLWDALRWMLWFDEWNQWSPLSCLECHKIFRPSTAHKVKYCTHACAHRATNREWRRRDLRKRKKRRELEAKGGTDGARKTR